MRGKKVNESMKKGKQIGGYLIGSFILHSMKHRKPPLEQGKGEASQKRVARLGKTGRGRKNSPRYKA